VQVPTDPTILAEAKLSGEFEVRHERTFAGGFKPWDWGGSL
jgi:hypothetical protein